MAEEALRKLEKQLSCTICHRPYTDPKVLQCQHAFCQLCLQGKVTEDKLNVICQEPGCAHATPTPVGGVANLPPATYISRLLDLQETFRAINSSPVGNCPAHPDKECDLYCLKCKKLMCSYCGLKGNKHYGHDFTMVNEGFEKCKDEFSKPLGSMKEHESSIGEALSIMGARSGEVAIQHAALDAKIRSTMKHLHDTLYDREANLLSQLNQITQGKVDTLEMQNRLLETTQAQLSSCLEVIDESLASRKEGAVLKDRKIIKNQLGDAVAAFDPHKLPPSVESDMDFAFTSMSALCRNFGQVHAPSSPDPRACYLVGNGIEEAIVGEPSIVLLQVTDYRGEPFKAPVKSITSEFISETADSKTRGRVERKGQSQYKISYQAAVQGKHSLHIKLDGQHISGSPFAVKSRLSCTKAPSLVGHMTTCFLP